MVKILILLVMSFPAWSATYYVTTTGSDGAPGSQSKPWLTIGHAVSVVSAGDTVLVGGGTYSEKVTIQGLNGNSSNWITIKNLDGETPILDGTGFSVGSYAGLFTIANSSYIRIQGFEIRNSSFYGVGMSGNSMNHIEILDCDIHDNSASGIWTEDHSGSPMFITFSGNEVHNNATGGITLHYSDGGYFLIENNDVHSNTGTNNYDGIQIGTGDGGAHHVVVRGNYAHDNGSAGKGEDPLDLGGRDIYHHYLVEHNIVDQGSGTGSFKLNSGNRNLGFGYDDGVSGFHIARFNTLNIGYEAYAFPNPIAFYNNTSVDAGRALFFYRDAGGYDSFGDSTHSADSDLGRLTMKNNIFWQEARASGYAILWGGASIDFSYSSLKGSNNLWKLQPGQTILWDAGSFAGSASGFASFQASNSPDNPESGSIYTSQSVSDMFVNYAVGDYSLKASSLAVDAGLPLTVTTNKGSNSTNLVLEKSSYFQDGYPANGERLVNADWILITPTDACDSNADIVQIDTQNDATQTITLASAATWGSDENVYLYRDSYGTQVLFGCEPDIGAIEYDSVGPSPDTSPPSPPSNLQVQ